MQAFNKQSVEALAARPLFAKELNFRYVFVGIDPAGGGKLSDYAIVSFVFNEADQSIIVRDTSSARSCSRRVSSV
jgi:hypothetical protein